MDKALQELISMLKEASPIIWSALVKQVYIEATARIIWAVAFLVVVAILCKVVGRQKSAYDEEWGDGHFLTDSPWAWLYGGIALAGVLSFALSISAAMWLSNPEFYAIRFLLDRLGK